MLFRLKAGQLTSLLRSMSEARLRSADDPSNFLVLILDVDIESWARAPGEEQLSAENALARLQTVAEHVLAFVNTFLLLHERNRIGIILSGRHGFQVAYPSVSDATSFSGSREFLDAEDGAFDAATTAPSVRNGSLDIVAMLPSALAEAICESVDAQTCAENIGRHPHVSSSLATALCMINRRHALKLRQRGIQEMTKSNGNGGSLARQSHSFSPMDSISSFTTVDCHARILVILASADISDQYVPVMNCISSAQRMRVPIDTCMLLQEVDSTYFQQAAHLSGGIYLRPASLTRHIDDSLQQYLVTAFLPDALSREYLATPAQGEVDFRATCFKTGKMIEEGYTCSVCLSTYDLSVGKKAFSCPTCRARFAVAPGSIGSRRPPVVSNANTRN